MGFPQRLTTLRKDRHLTQAVLADRVGIHVTQLRRYEADTSQPTLDVLKQLAIELRISADFLLFEEGERGPSDDLRLQFEALSKLDPAERNVIKTVVEAILLQHEAHRWTSLTPPTESPATSASSRKRPRPATAGSRG